MLIASLGGLLWWLPRPALPAACCVSATSFGVGRLLIWEQFAVGLQVGHARSVGQWDARHALRWHAADLADGLSLLQPWGIVRLHERIQAQAWLPLLLNDRRSAGESQLAGGLGDVGLGARFELLAIGQYAWVPAVAVTVAALGPTGRRVEQTRPPLFAGTTGRGTWGGSLALETEVAFLPWFVRLDASLSGFLPFERPDSGQRQQYGPLGRLMLSSGRELVPDTWVLALALLGEWEGRLRLDGEAVARSQAYLTTLSLALSWHVDQHWTAIATLANSIWPRGGGMNRDARLGLTLGVRYGYF